MFKFSQKSISRLEGVDIRLKEVAELALTLTPIDFGIPSTGGLRTAEQQNNLYLEGKSRRDGIKRKSLHQLGTALDVYAYVDGKASWQKDHLTIIAGAMLESARRLGYKITWGGWWPWDMPHFQLED